MREFRAQACSHLLRPWRTTGQANRVVEWAGPERPAAHHDRYPDKGEVALHGSDQSTSRSGEPRNRLLGSAVGEPAETLLAEVASE